MIHKISFNKSINLILNSNNYKTNNQWIAQETMN